MLRHLDGRSSRLCPWPRPPLAGAPLRWLALLTLWSERCQLLPLRLHAPQQQPRAIRAFNVALRAFNVATANSYKRAISAFNVALRAFNVAPSCLCFPGKGGALLPLCGFRQAFGILEGVVKVVLFHGASNLAWRRLCRRWAYVLRR